jgi:tetratricopeptide (TPR) repeat protein
LADLNFVLTRDPGHREALSNRSRVFYRTGKYRECLGDLAELLRGNPNDAGRLNLAGVCYSRLGETNNAISMFDRAIGLNPQKGMFWLNRSLAYHKAQNKGKALADALQAKKLGARVDGDYIDDLKQ